ncbi:UNVERIFIED_CONTAM: hypothetical protein Sradi_3282000 [Sesamum radiatum]|uniref:Tf2-1-like SH3-like domain-containing protein n=1 Tax=Sesamum radiatum TaxID=300843 RepID=A0AAW2R0N7_SESRA
MKQYTDAKRKEREFIVGDMVYLKLQPYRQTSAQVRKNLKLAPKYFGPFKVIEKIGTVAYKLELPPHSNIHPVFTTHPVKILGRRMIPRNNAPVMQILIQWEGFEEDQTTWEDYYQIQKQFPDFDLSPRGQGSQKEGRNVTFAAAEISRLKMGRQIRSEGAKSNGTMKGTQFGRTIPHGVVPENATMKARFSLTQSDGV